MIERPVHHSHLTSIAAVACVVAEMAHTVSTVKIIKDLTGRLHIRMHPSAFLDLPLFLKTPITGRG
jgi:hypothetical protein